MTSSIKFAISQECSDRFLKLFAPKLSWKRGQFWSSNPTGPFWYVVTYICMTSISAPHICNYYCVINCWPSEASKTFNKNPLRLPEICSWSRELSKIKGSGRRHVIYRTPCGRVLVSINEPFLFSWYPTINLLWRMMMNKNREKFPGRRIFHSPFIIHRRRSS